MKIKNLPGLSTTNAMEGGNFRIKWNLRVPYSNLQVCGGRVILGAIYDSVYTFRNGRPCESFAHKHSTFTYADIMRYEGGGIQSSVSVEPPFEGELGAGLAEALVN